MERYRLLISLAGGLLLFPLAACMNQDTKGSSGAASPAGTTPSATGTEASKAPAGAGGAMARASIEGRSGSSLSGTATFSETPEGVKVMVNVKGALPGQHAVHIHEKGDCSASDAMSAGGHFNPEPKHHHGGPNSPDHHPGDFGNMMVSADGTGKLELVTKDLTVAAGSHSLVGLSIIVHEKADDLKSDPSGNAGGRIGCGVIQKVSP